MTRIFYDLEFTGLHKDTTIISIGLTAEDGRNFYAEFNDYDKSQVDQWIKDNVCKNLILPIRDRASGYTAPDNFYSEKNNTVMIFSDKETISKELNKWLSQFDSVEFVSDVCHYDFVLLIDLICGNALDLPDNICPACYDINQLIAEKKHVSQMDAFNYNREALMEELPGCERFAVLKLKHNSLYDAFIIKKIYQHYKSL